MRVVTGLPDPLRAQAAHLYWQAFGSKLGRVLGPEDRALAFLCDSMAGDCALSALDDAGQLLGVIGFRTGAGGFAGGSFAALARTYGRAGALWRGAALWALTREVDNERFLIDGLCVAAHARGQGVGTALIEALVRSPAAQGYREMRLDVIDTNLRARALYERLGFRTLRIERLGPLRHLFGFDAAVTMVRPLA